MAELQKILLCRFNNYYNKLKMRPRTAAQYRAAGYVLYTEGDNEYGLNFWPNDGVNTAHVFNCDAEDAEAADYAVVIDFTTDAVISRWFVMEAVKNLRGQYNITLHRDVIADNWEAVMTAPAMLQRGPILDKYDTLIFNDEGNTYNRIKRSETPLKDALGTPWIVGYMTKPNTENPDQDPYYIVRYKPSFTGSDETMVNLTSEEWAMITGLQSKEKGVYTDMGIGARITGIDNTAKGAYYLKETRMVYNPQTSTGDTRILWDPEPLNGYYHATPSDLLYNVDLTWREWRANHVSQYNSVVTALLGTMPASLISTTDYWALYRKINGKTCEYDGVQYHVQMDITSETSDVSIVSQNVDANQLLVDFFEYARTNGYGNIIPQNQAGYRSNPVAYQKTNVNVTLNIVNSGDIAVDIHKSHDQLDDAPWSMFAIPIYPILAKWHGSTDPASQDYNLYMTTTTLSAYAIARAMTERWGGSFLKDLQIVPWCPMPEAVVEDEVTHNAYLDLTLLHRSSYGNTLSENAYRWSKVEELYQIDQDQTEHWRAVNVMLWCDKCSGDVQLKGPTIDLPYGKTPEEYKVIIETHIARLVSPNQNGAFEFKPGANYGVHAEDWLGRWTYKPFSPFIQVSPRWKAEGLYGGIWKDTRGLICQGDFSMPQTSSAWETYMVNNKNYQAAFDRTIDHLEFTQAQEKRMQEIGMATGAFSGAMRGGMAGTAGGVGGMGAVAGAVVSIAGGIVDYEMLKDRQREAQSYQRDLYRMNLENIQAQPANINKVGAMDYSFRMWPVLEQYTATEEEESSLVEQLAETGFRLGKLGKIQDRMVPGRTLFVQANIIRLPGLAGDYHVATEIAAEAARGMFMEGE